MKSKDREYGFRARGLEPAPRNDSPRICVAQIGAPHGVRGEVRIKSFTADPMALKDYGALTIEDGSRSFAIEALRPAKDVMVAKLAGVADRDAAEALCNLRLYVPRDRLPAADADEFYHADLVGLIAVTPNGSAIGTVTALHNFGAGDLIEIAPEAGGPSLLLPFTKAVVPEVDIATSRVVVDPPEVTDEPSPLVGEGGEPRRGGPGEGLSRSEPLTRLAPLGTLSHKGRGK